MPSIDVQVQTYLHKAYHRVISGETSTGYLGEVLELPGCYTSGSSAEETLNNLDEAMTAWITSALAHGDLILEPGTGKVLLSA